MSNIYIQEPPTEGKVLLTTSLGEIEIELWSKEAPKACRNFVQLCLEGYYDNIIFHRVVKDFIAQGGDPTGTGTGGESIYGKPFKDEFHQRLKFNRRGLVAMANAGADDNLSQFFFTLGRADELQKKHTIFGKVGGHTIYNMIRFNELEVDENERPLDPPTIHKTEVLSNPFDDIEPRQTKKKLEKADTDKKKIKSKSKATKNYKLLSFGEEAEEDEEETETVTKDLKIKSSHDLLEDPKLSSEPALDETAIKEASIAAGEVREKLKKKQQEDEAKRKEESDSDEDEAKKKAVRRKALQEEAKQLKRAINAKEKDEEPAPKKEKKAEKEPVNELMRELLEERKGFMKTMKESTLLKKGGKRENETLDLLASFESRLLTATTDDAPIKTGDEGDSDEDSGWMTHSLNFEEDEVSKAKDANMKGDDWYDIYDPRNAITKERNKQAQKEAKQKRKSKLDVL